MNDKFFEKIGVRSTNWKVEDDCLIFPDRGKLVGLGNLNKVENNLIAAAPEMLEALIEACEEPCKDCKTYRNCKKALGCCQKIYGPIIEKATNKQIDEVMRLWEESCE